MKKIYILLLFVVGCAEGVAVAKRQVCQTDQFNVDAGHQLLQLIAQPRELFDQLEQLAVDLHDSPQGFLDALTTRDQQGWTVLIHFVTKGDQQSVRRLLHVVKKFFGDNQKSLATFLNYEDTSERSALDYAILRKNVTIAQLLIDWAIRHFGKNDKLFNQFINKPGGNNNRTPLLFAAAQETEMDDAMLQMLVHKVETVWPQDSEQFQAFINARDNDGQTALNYLDCSRSKQFLKQCGGVKTKNLDIF